MIIYTSKNNFDNTFWINYTNDSKIVSCDDKLWLLTYFGAYQFYHNYSFNDKEYEKVILCMMNGNKYLKYDKINWYFRPRR